MSQLALYRAWRPQTFDEVVAQKQVVFPLKQAVLSGDIGHAYLFAGTRGTGKTSMAKIFAKAVNCLNSHDGNPCNECAICQGVNSGALLDVMEIDAASHNSVDNIRRLTDEVMFMPSEARYKVYIIDEVHMLSQGAFNALLKTLEEPPAHVIFILATTEVQRIPATILSRCQRFEFRRIPLQDIFQRLKDIAQADHIDITDDALMMMARLGDGALRDAISLLDQAQAGIKGQIKEADVLNLAGLVQDEFLADFCQQVLSADLPAALASIEELQMSGRDMQRFLQDFLRYLRDILVVGLGGDSQKLLTESPEGLKRLQNLAQLTNSQEIMDMLGRLSQLNNDLRWSTDPRTSLELAFISEIARRQSQLSDKPVPAPLQPQASDNASSQTQAAAKLLNSAPTDPAGPAKAQSQTNSMAGPVPTPLQPQASDNTSSQTQAAAKPLNSAPTAPVGPAKAQSQTNSMAGPTPTPRQPRATAILHQSDKAEDGAPLTTTAANNEQAVKSDQSSNIVDTAVRADTRAQISWNMVLDGLRDRNRYDIVLLLRPAKVNWQDGDLYISYEPKQKAHAEALQRPENQEVLLDAVYELSQAKGLGRPRLHIELAGTDLAAGENLNPAEPVWVQKLRKASEEFQVPFDPADVKPMSAGEDPAPFPDQAFYQFPEAEDKLPY